MKTLKSLLASLCLLVSFFSYGQKLTWGPEDTKIDFRARDINADPITFYDNDSYYIIRHGRLSNFSFEKFDKNSKKTIEVIVDIKSTLGSKYNDNSYSHNNFNWIVILKKESFLFVTQRIEANKDCVIEFFELTKNGVLKSEKLYELRYENYWSCKIFTDNTPGLDDVSKIIVCNYGSPANYKKHNSGNVEANFCILDKNLKLLRTTNVQLPYENNSFSISDCVAGQDNSVHAACRVFRPKLEANEHSYEVFSSYPDNKLVLYKTSEASYYLSSAQVKLLPENKLLIFGAYKQDGVKVFEGFLFGKVDIALKNEPTFTKNPLDKAYTALYMDSKLRPKFFNRFTIKELTLDELGNYDLIIQNEFYTEICNSSNCTDIYNYGHIYATKVSPEGKLLSLADIAKFQNSNFGNNFSSFLSYRKDGKLYIIFNDYEANANAANHSDLKTYGMTAGTKPYIVSVDSKGAVTRKVFTLITEDLFLKPISCIKVGNDYIIFAEKQDRMRLCRLKIQ